VKIPTTDDEIQQFQRRYETLAGCLTLLFFVAIALSWTVFYNA
jgi:hypothetical protein